MFKVNRELLHKSKNCIQKQGGYQTKQSHLDQLNRRTLQKEIGEKL